MLESKWHLGKDGKGRFAVRALVEGQIAAESAVAGHTARLNVPMAIVHPTTIVDVTAELADDVTIGRVSSAETAEADATDYGRGDDEQLVAPRDWADAEHRTGRIRGRPPGR